MVVPCLMQRLQTMQTTQRTQSWAPLQYTQLPLPTTPDFDCYCLCHLLVAMMIHLTADYWRSPQLAVQPGNSVSQSYWPPMMPRLKVSPNDAVPACYLQCTTVYVDDHVALLFHSRYGCGAAHSLSLRSRAMCVALHRRSDELSGFVTCRYRRGSLSSAFLTKLY
jgi:hypothetical protein